MGVSNLGSRTNEVFRHYVYDYLGCTHFGDGTIRRQRVILLARVSNSSFAITEGITISIEFFFFFFLVFCTKMLCLAAKYSPY